MIPLAKKEDEVRSSDDSSSSSGSEDKRDNLIFWELLKSDKVKIKQVSGRGVLLGGIKGLGHGGSIYVSAKKAGESRWELSKQDGHDWTQVYLLNYAAKQVTCVRRDAYESDHNFFITVELSGCRFTVTDTYVLHIAADVGVSHDRRSGAEKRDVAEHTALKRTAPESRRRVSVTERPGSQNYIAGKGEALVSIARNIMIERLPDFPFAADSLWGIYKEKGASADTINAMVATATHLAKTAGKDDAEAGIIAGAVRTATEAALPGILSTTSGAFIFGVKTGTEWNYYALINGIWSDINPVPLVL
ncbi:hypothetical protein M2401_001099 [Pseudomonas sp. JUb42]|uniref:hypothetical protein n=1 Tax=Pseudomonas sp. JUb42 TaxID=2940611 RepID=UPI00216A11ED|nr:hypothetical protein [Pseudomonas sp. JUb42]MCS3467378.1 hypothetical protein [Pseudomonas sp. JUb42]